MFRMLRMTTAVLELANVGNIWSSEHVDNAAADTSTWFSVAAALFNFTLSVATCLLSKKPQKDGMMGPPKGDMEGQPQRPPQDGTSNPTPEAAL